MLFLTHTKHHHAGMSAQFDPDTYAWRSVELAAAVPFFLIDIGRPEQGRLVIEQRLVNDVEELSNLVAQRDAGTIEHLGVNVLCPSWMNRYQGWRMYSLREIWCKRGEPAYDFENLKFVTDAQELMVRPEVEPHSQWTLVAKLN